MCYLLQNQLHSSIHSFIHLLNSLLHACYGPTPVLGINTKRQIPALQGSPRLVKESLQKGTEGGDCIFIGAFI